MEGTPSPKVVQQRVRNRMIEVLEIAASFETQRTVEPNGIDANELINLWEDWCSGPETPLGFDRDVLPRDEAEAIRAFHVVWERVAESTPNPLGPFAETQRLTAWRELAEAAAKALSVLAVRGRLPED